MSKKGNPSILWFYQVPISNFCEVIYSRSLIDRSNDGLQLKIPIHCQWHNYLHLQLHSGNHSYSLCYFQEIYSLLWIYQEMSFLPWILQKIYYFIFCRDGRGPKFGKFPTKNEIQKIPKNRIFMGGRDFFWNGRDFLWNF